MPPGPGPPSPWPTPTDPPVLKLTKRTEYALIALVHLADREGSSGGPLVSAREISERYPVPRRLVAEVLKDLCKADLVSSQRGASGGYALSRPAAEISLGEVIAALEGRPSLTGCETAGAASGHGPCEVEPVCPIKSPMQRVRLGIWDLMVRTSLLDLARGQRPGRRDETADPIPARSANPSQESRARTRSTSNNGASPMAHVLPLSTP